MKSNKRIGAVAVAGLPTGVLDYLLPESIPTPPIGVRVRVPLQKREIVGILIAIKHHSDIARDKLKPIVAILDSTPLIPPPMMQLCEWVSQYYHSPLGDVFATALPSLLRQGKTATLPQPPTVWQLTDQQATVSANAHRQRSALAFLSQHPQGITLDQAKQAQIHKTTLTTLEQKGWVRQNILEATHTTQPNLNLNQHQQAAKHSIQQHYHHYMCFLLHGVTGSGKTEVYLQVMQPLVDRQRQILILVPEIGLTPQIAQRIQQRFGAPMVVLHSGLTEKQRSVAWLQAHSGKAIIVVGTRSAIFTPLPKLGMIIVDEEHDPSFKQQDRLHYCARNSAIVRANQQNIPIILGSATPSLESLHNVSCDKTCLLNLPERAGPAQNVQFHIIDMNYQSAMENLSTPLIHKIRTHLANGNQVLLFINRRGFAPVFMCQSCGHMAKCIHCETYLTLHTQPNYLLCHHCGYRHYKTHCCIQCASPQLIPLGSGTERIEQVLTQEITEAKILRIDRDSTRSKQTFTHMLEQIHSKQVNLLLGTQMLAKGHHFPDVTLVGILNADSGFFSSDFRSGERLGQLLLQVAGRAGRAEQPGEVIIQTHVPNHPLLHALINKGYRAFAQTILDERQQTHLPPYSFLALIRCEAKATHTAFEFLTRVKQLITPTPRPITLMGPVPAVLERRAGWYRAQLLIKTNQRHHLKLFLGMLRDKIATLRGYSQVKWSLDVDPTELF